MCTHEDMLAHSLGAPYFDYVMSYYSLTIEVKIKIKTTEIKSK